MNKLETKVEARNKVNALANEHATRIRAALSAFAGQKVILATGAFSAKFCKAVEDLGLPCVPNQHIWISAGHGYSITANFRVSVTDGSTLARVVAVYLFDLTNGVLVLNPNYSLNQLPLRTDFDATAIRAAREVVQQKRKELQAAEAALCYFGEHDNH